MTNDDELLHRCADSVATTEEMACLAERLKGDVDLRTRYLDLMNLDTALQAQADAATAAMELGPRSARSGWMRPYAAAAAGLVLGGVAVGTAWAITTPSGRTEEGDEAVSVPLGNAGFEHAEGPQIAGVPAELHLWQGDPCEALESHGAVVSHQGSRFLRFKAASASGDKPDGKNMACDLWQVVELPELPGKGPGIVRVQAWFNSSSDQQARFHLMAMAADSPPADMPELWEQRYTENSLVPSAARSMIFVDRNSTTWERGEVVLHVPAGVRTLMVAIGAYRLPTWRETEWFPGQYVDAVSASFVAE